MTPEQEYAMRWFRDFYSKTELPVPKDFPGREFGFMFFDKDFVRRHVGFGSQEDLRRYLVNQVPMHVYYSSAHYENPNAPKMEQKGWRGADLVFDLDADHIPGAEKMTYEEMLYIVKQDMIRLLDDFLLGDLGFGEDEVRITFSGGRGYHAHVQADSVQRLGSHERSEVVDFVTGTDLDHGWIFKERSALKHEYKSYTKVDIATLIPPEGSGGWKGKVRRRLSDLMEELELLGYEEAKAKYTAFSKLNDKQYFLLQRALAAERSGSNGRELILKNNSLEYITDAKAKEALLQCVKDTVRAGAAAQVDEPVTRDIKRLIRLPGSLHGKTGMRVISMSRDELNDFNPLRDAFSTIFPDTPQKVQVRAPVDLKLKGQRIFGEGVIEVPTFAAIFLILRLKALVV
jgi:DNA primase small subunit